MIHQRPEHFDLQQTRWTLAAILQACRWLRMKTLAGVHRLLKRLHIHRKRSRGHMHSPDLDYVGKLHHVWLWLRAVIATPGNGAILPGGGNWLNTRPQGWYQVTTDGKQMWVEKSP